MVLLSKSILRKKLSDLLPLDNESLDQIIDYSLNLNSKDEISQHIISLIGESSLVLKYIEDIWNYKNQSHHKQGLKNNSKKESQNVWNNANNKNHKKPVNDNSKPTKKAILNKKSHTVSEVLPQENRTQHKPKTKTKTQKLNDITELDELIKKLDISNTGSNLKCDCMAIRHGLNKAVPNCLNCGKIICLKEKDRTSCSFCNHELISIEEKLEMIRFLQVEKSKLIEETSNYQYQAPKKKKKEKFTIKMEAGSSFFNKQDELFKGIEKNQQKTKQNKIDMEKLNSDLSNAESTLNKLLGYQEDSVARTKIIDQVSDYSLPDELNIWTKSSLDKILELKKQQKNLKKKEKLELERNGRNRKIMSLNIKNDGKVSLSESIEQESSSEDDEEIKKIEDEIKKEEKKNQEINSKFKWDYSKDLQKWQARKPKYLGSITSMIDNETDDENDEKIERLQTSVKEDLPIEELLINL